MKTSKIELGGKKQEEKRTGRNRRSVMKGKGTGETEEGTFKSRIRKKRKVDK